MKINKLCISVAIAAVCTVLCSFTTAFAGEKTVFDKSLVGVYEGDKLSRNNWGDLEKNDAEYAKGNKWASTYGGEGWYSDGETGLLLHPKVGSLSGNELVVRHKLIAGTLPEDTQLRITYEFDTLDRPVSSTGEAWFRLGTTNPTKNSCLFMLKSSPSDGLTYGFASITSGYPMTCKDFDRISGSISFDYNSHYKVVITIKPNSGTYKYVAEVYKDDDKIGSGLIEDYTGYTYGALANLAYIDMNCVSRSAIDREEAIVAINSIKLEAIYEDTALDASYFPKNLSEGNSLDTDCYASFPMPVEEVSIDNVTVLGGAVAEDVYISDDGKRVNVELSGLKEGTTYEIVLKDVVAAGSTNPFTYKWSFTTGNAVAISNVTTLKNVFSESMGDIDLTGLCADTDDEYLAGEAWGSVGSDASGGYVISDGYLVVKPVSATANGWTGHVLSKRFTPAADNETLILGMTIKVNNNSYWNRACSVRLVNSETQENFTMFRMVSLGSISLTALGTNSAIGTAVTADEQAITGLALNKDAYFEFTAEPNGDVYNVTLTIKQDGIDDIILTRTLSAEQVMGLNSVQVWSHTVAFNTRMESFAVKNVDINVGSKSLNSGTNKVYFDYTNTDSDTPADFEALIIEHKNDDGTDEFGTIKSVTVKKFESVEGAQGQLECEFEVTDDESKVDIYFVNSVDSMNLLSDKVEL